MKKHATADEGDLKLPCVDVGGVAFDNDCDCNDDDCCCANCGKLLVALAGLLPGLLPLQALFELFTK